ncbi:hypothetical protein BH11PSE8_BH11PSE8_06460 [soil metagenome]
MGLQPDNRWIGGYVDYEWDHLRHVVQALPVTLKGLRVLEFGSNVGASAILLAHLGANVSGVDITHDVVKLAQLNAERFCQDGVQFQCVPDTRAMPFCDGEFDLIACNSVLEYVVPSDLAAVQREIDRVLKPGGLILVSGSSNRVWPYEVHSGRWWINYVPRIFDRIRGKSVERGIWPWVARYGFGPNYINLDTAHAQNYFSRSRTLMGASPIHLKWLLWAAARLRIGPGLLAQSVSCLLKKRAD